MFQEYLINISLVVMAMYSSIHALIHKKDPRSAFGWIAVCVVLPFFGPILYFLFGVNRVKTRAQSLINSNLDENGYAAIESKKGLFDEGMSESLKNINRVSNKITQLPLVGGNKIKNLYSGEEAYLEMLSEINAANNYIYLCVYIFKKDSIGQRFIDALISAKNRGVEVYVLIDGVGELYSMKKVRKALLENNVKVCRFLPLSLMPFHMSINLRNHRKLLIIDNKISFVGGMNISDEYVQKVSDAKKPLSDLHFKIIGDVAFHLKYLFESDWRFAGGEIDGENVMSYQDSLKSNVCRVIADGPGNNLGHLSIILLCAINAAQNEIILITPYFLPNRELIAALQAASLRGVKVMIILPEKNNLNYVQWASRHMQWELLEYDVDIYYQPPPFSHAKLFIIDHQYSLIGSANIDPRSLRLNYEVGIEVYDAEFATKLGKYARNILMASRKVTLKEVDNRAILVKIRDGVAWLFSPYL